MLHSIHDGHILEYLLIFFMSYAKTLINLFYDEDYELHDESKYFDYLEVND
jgi:hypothetical protein